MCFDVFRYYFYGRLALPTQECRCLMNDCGADHDYDNDYDYDYHCDYDCDYDFK